MRRCLCIYATTTTTTTPLALKSAKLVEFKLKPKRGDSVVTWSVVETVVASFSVLAGPCSCLRNTSLSTHNNTKHAALRCSISRIWASISTGCETPAVVWLSVWNYLRSPFQSQKEISISLNTVWRPRNSMAKYGFIVVAAVLMAMTFQQGTCGINCALVVPFAITTHSDTCDEWCFFYSVYNCMNDWLIQCSSK